MMSRIARAARVRSHPPRRLAGHRDDFPYPGISAAGAHRDCRVRRPRAGRIRSLVTFIEALVGFLIASALAFAIATLFVRFHTLEEGLVSHRHRN